MLTGKRKLESNMRKNNFLYGKEDPAKPKLEDEEPLEIDLTQEEFNYAVRMTEHSIWRLSKAHIIELK